MLKIVLIDDEERVRMAIGQLFELYHPECNVVASCSSLALGIEAIRQFSPQVVLIDIEIGQENGLEIFKVFPNPAFKVIFVTAYQHYAIQAFRLAALDYLLKPIQADVLAGALSRAERELQRDNMSVQLEVFIQSLQKPQKQAEKIVLKTTESIHLVELDSIMYCEADRAYTRFFLADKTRIMVSINLGEYEELFEPFGFCRIHQSYLVNLAYFKRYDKSDGGIAVLKDDSRLPVATRKKEYLMKRLGMI